MLGLEAEVSGRSFPPASPLVPSARHLETPNQGGHLQTGQHNSLRQLTTLGHLIYISKDKPGLVFQYPSQNNCEGGTHLLSLHESRREDRNIH